MQRFCFWRGTRKKDSLPRVHYDFMSSMSCPAELSPTPLSFACTRDGVACPASCCCRVPGGFASWGRGIRSMQRVTNSAAWCAAWSEEPGGCEVPVRHVPLLFGVATGQYGEKTGSDPVLSVPSAGRHTGHLRGWSAADGGAASVGRLNWPGGSQPAIAVSDGAANWPVARGFAPGGPTTPSTCRTHCPTSRPSSWRRTRPSARCMYRFLVSVG